MVNYTVTHKHLPVADIVCNVEPTITHRPTDKAEDIRQDISYTEVNPLKRHYFRI